MSKIGKFTKLIMKEYLTLKRNQLLKGRKICDKDALLEMNLMMDIYGSRAIVAELLHVLKILSCQDGSVPLHALKQNTVTMWNP